MRRRGGSARARLLVLLAVGGLLLECGAGVLLPFMAAQAAGATREGTLGVIWGDTLSGSAVPGGDRRIFLTEDTGDRTELFVPAAVLTANGGVAALAGRRVVVDLESVPQSAPARRAAGGAPPAPVGVRSLSRVRSYAPQATELGVKPYLTILCKFADISDEPMNQSYFDGLMSGANPYGLNAYWQEASLGAISLDGSASVAWAAMPQAKAYYFPYGQIDFERITPDCLGVAASSVNFDAYVGVNLAFNSHLSLDANPISGSAWGGSYPIYQNGQYRDTPMTWLPPWAYRGVPSVTGAGIYPMTHEMGHAFNLAHSADVPNGEYYDGWDVMSAVYALCGNANVQPYGCLAQHANGYHKDVLGWIPPARRFTYASVTRRVTLRPLNGDTAGDYLLAVIPTPGDASRFITVEFRHRAGFDRKLPGEGVIIHEVVAWRNTPAVVQGADGSAGAVFGPGQSYSPTGTGLTVTVGAVSASDATVVISNGVAPAVTGLSATTGDTNGGTPIGLSGTNLSPEATVRFGAAPAALVVANADGSLTAVAPALPEGPYTITVTNPDGRSGTIAGWRAVIVPRAQPAPRGAGVGTGVPNPDLPRAVGAPVVASTPLPAPPRR